MKPALLMILPLAGCLSANGNGQPLVEIAPGYRVCATSVETALNGDIKGKAGISATVKLGCDNRPVYQEELEA